MESTQLHLVLNHFPILGTLFGICLLACGLLRKNETLEKAGLVTLVLIALITIPAYLTGEEAEHTVEHLPGISKHQLEEHEEHAETALWAMMITGTIALLALVIPALRNNSGKTLKIIGLLLASITFGMMVLVGDHGGKIRRGELRDGPDEHTEQYHEHHGEFQNEHD